MKLSWPPSTNTYWRNFRGHMVLSKVGRDFKKAVQEYVITKQIPKFGDSRVTIKLVLNPRDRRKIDIDNRIKAVLDSLEDAGVINNDFQVDYLEVIRGEPEKGGSVIVTIESMEHLHDPGHECYNSHSTELGPQASGAGEASS